MGKKKDKFKRDSQKQKLVRKIRENLNDGIILETPFTQNLVDNLVKSIKVDGTC